MKLLNQGVPSGKVEVVTPNVSQISDMTWLAATDYLWHI